MADTVAGSPVDILRELKERRVAIQNQIAACGEQEKKLKAAVGHAVIMGDTKTADANQNQLNALRETRGQLEAALTEIDPVISDVQQDVYRDQQADAKDEVSQRLAAALTESFNADALASELAECVERISTQLRAANAANQRSPLPEPQNYDYTVMVLSAVASRLSQLERKLGGYSRFFQPMSQNSSVVRIARGTAQ